MLTAQTQTSVKTTQNTFTDGLVMDFNDLVMPSSALANCLNGTTVTYNGNEFMLLNDMGNGRVLTAYLPAGYVPVGIKEHGGVIYVAATNPLTGKGQIGSFPSPERQDNDGKKGRGLEIDFLLNSKASVGSNTIFRSGDKFVIEFCDKTNGYTYYSKLISNCYNTTASKIKSPKKKFIDLDLVVLNSSSGYTSIVPELNRYVLTESDNYETIFPKFKTGITDKNILLNTGYWALFNPSTRLGNSSFAADTEMVDIAVLLNKIEKLIYNEKIFGKLKVVSKINSLQSYNVGYRTYICGTESSPRYLAKIQIKYTYNCPDTLYSNPLTDINEWTNASINKTPKVLILENGDLLEFSDSSLSNLYVSALGNSEDFSKNSLYGSELKIGDCTYNRTLLDALNSPDSKKLVLVEKDEGGYKTSKSNTRIIQPPNAKNLITFTTKRGNTINAETYLYWYDPEEDLYTFIDTWFIEVDSSALNDSKLSFSIVPKLDTNVENTFSSISGTLDFTDAYVAPTLNTWKFYYGSGGLTINWGLNYKLEEEEEIEKVEFKFYSITESSTGDTLSATAIFSMDSGMSSYNGNFYDTFSNSDLAAGYAYVVKIVLTKNTGVAPIELKAWALTTTLYNEEYESGTIDDWTAEPLNEGKLTTTLLSAPTYKYVSNPLETLEASYELGSKDKTFKNTSTKNTSYEFISNFVINNAEKYPSNLEFSTPTVSYALNEEKTKKGNATLTFTNVSGSIYNVKASLESALLTFSKFDDASILVRNVFKPYSSTSCGSLANILKKLKCELTWSKSGNNHVNYDMIVYDLQGNELTRQVVDLDYVKSKDNDNYLSDFYDNITYLVGNNTNIIKLQFGSFNGLLMLSNDNTWCIISTNTNIPDDFNKLYVSGGPATKVVSVPDTSNVTNIAASSTSYTPVIEVSTSSTSNKFKLGSTDYLTILNKFSDYPINNLKFVLSTSAQTELLTLESEQIDVEGPNNVITLIKQLIGSGCDLGWQQGGTGTILILSSSKYDSGEIYYLSSGKLVALPSDTRYLLNTDTISNQTVITPASVLKVYSDNIYMTCHDRKWHLKGTLMWPDLNLT